MSHRKLIARMGKPGQWVRVVDEIAHAGRAPVFRVLYTEHGEKHTRSYDRNRDGKRAALLFAESIVAGRAAPVVTAGPSATLRAVWLAFVKAHQNWRPATYRANWSRWGRFEMYLAADVKAETVDEATMDDFRKHMAVRPVTRGITEGKRGHSATQVRHHVQLVRQVFRFAVRRKLIPPTAVTEYSYEEHKDAPRLKTAEFRAPERAKILAALRPRHTYEWRPYVLTAILATQAARISATLALTWADVDLDAGLIHWPAGTDKQGRARVQPMTPEARDGFYVALGWAQKAGYTGPLVFFRMGAGTRDGSGHRSARQANRKNAKPDQPVTAQSYYGWLQKACERAGVDRAKYQAAHAHRRGVSGDVADALDVDAAADWIGDSDTRVVRRSYRLTRPEHAERAGAVVPRIEGEQP